MCCGIALQCRRVLQCGFAVGCEDSEDTGFCPLRIIGCAPEQYMSQEMPNLRRFLARFLPGDNNFENYSSISSSNSTAVSSKRKDKYCFMFAVTTDISFIIELPLLRLS